MKKEEIIEMARQAGFSLGHNVTEEYLKKLEAFAKLVDAKATAKERERYMQLFLDPENQPTQFGTATQEYREREIKDEREACAKLAQETICDTHIPTGVNIYGTRAAKAIRARGETTSRGEVLASPIIKSYLEKDNLEENLYGIAIKADNGGQPEQEQSTTWRGLTDEEAQWLYDNCRTPSSLIDMTEAKLKEKNA